MNIQFIRWNQGKIILDERSSYEWCVGDTDGLIAGNERLHVCVHRHRQFRRWVMIWTENPKLIPEKQSPPWSQHSKETTVPNEERWN